MGSTYTMAEQLELKRAWETGLNLQEVKARLAELGVSFKGNKREAVILLIDLHAPLGGGPVTWINPETDDTDEVTETKKRPRQTDAKHEDGAPPTEKRLKSMEAALSTLTALVQDLVSDRKNPGKALVSLPSSASHVAASNSGGGGSTRLQTDLKNARYVDLRDLRNNITREQYHVQLGNGWRMQQVDSSSPSQKPIKDTLEWTKLFRRLTDGYCEANPIMRQMMGKYSDWVLDLFGKDNFTFKGILEYDQEIRRSRQGPSADWNAHNVGRLFVHLLSSEHSDRSDTKGSGKESGKRSSRQKRKKGKKATCHAWNRGEECKYQNCRFRHACKDCGSEDHGEGHADCPGPGNG